MNDFSRVKVFESPLVLPEEKRGLKTKGARGSLVKLKRELSNLPRMCLICRMSFAQIAALKANRQRSPITVPEKMDPKQ